MKKKIEILAPAGSLEAMKAAIQAGADAVYIGGEKFGARAFAHNLTQEEMLEAIDYAHLYRKKIYLTVNTLVKQEEMDALYDYLLPFYLHGLDAVIVQDFGVLSYVGENFKGIDIHASTQMTLAMAEGAEFLKEYGVTRLVTSRELDFAEIKRLRRNTSLEIESFVHGALCYSYSGQCLMSSLIGGRSGNRGRCAQPCRKEYEMENGKKGFLLSPKDMCMIEQIPELVESGIDSFKIEGRMKRPEYAAMTAFLYRKYTDLYLELGKKDYALFIKKHEKEMQQDVDNLLDLYNRGGFSTGYYFAHNGKNMMAMERPNHSGLLVGKIERAKAGRGEISLCKPLNPQDVLEIRSAAGEKIYEFTVKDGSGSGAVCMTNITRGLKIQKGLPVYRTKNQKLLDTIQKEFVSAENRIPVSGYFKGRTGEPVMLTLENQEHKVIAYGLVAEEAEKQPVSEENIKKQLKKTKETKFFFEKITIDSSNDWFLPLGKINELRREAFAQLEQKITGSFYRKEMGKKNDFAYVKKFREGKKAGIVVRVMSIEQLKEAVDSDWVNSIYLHFSLAEELKDWNELLRGKEKGKSIYLIFPAVFRAKTWDQYLEKKTNGARLLDEKWLDGVLVKNLEEIAFLKDLSKQVAGNIILDYNMYIMNQETKKIWNKKGIYHFTAPLELNSRELKQLDIENFDIIVYGYLPVMVSAQCLLKNTAGCRQQSAFFTFQDRNHNQFYGKNYCSSCYNVILNGKPLHLVEYLEKLEQMKVKNIRLDFTMETREEMHQILKLYYYKLYGFEGMPDPVREYTKGHFKRGIE